MLIVGIKQHVFNFRYQPLQDGLRKNLEEGRKRVRNGSFLGKVIFSVDSQSVPPEIPVFGLANLL